MLVFITAAKALVIVTRSSPDPLEWKRLAKSTSNPLEWKRQEITTTTSAALSATESVDVGGSHYCVWDSVQSKVIYVPWPTGATTTKEGEAENLVRGDIKRDEGTSCVWHPTTKMNTCFPRPTATATAQ
ncbi:hypothetical protein BCR34DRAFT_583096 [Clohesyomyces aquaticus]|uniref:Uncharacterized protein n=1 Tax=Clohesyomyces aquaticus TaxID=1231657 RepID=A0A1Y2A7Z7_9PLEO|nr:hypothetical protein BCR34DRAFT_583096 [Clohesyomyces aquaticus]